MSISNQYNSGTHTKVQTAITAIATAFVNVPNFVGFNFSDSPGFEIRIRVDPDGRHICITTKSDQGPSNSYGTADSQGFYTRAPALVIDGDTQL